MPWEHTENGTAFLADPLLVHAALYRKIERCFFMAHLLTKKPEKSYYEV